MSRGKRYIDPAIKAKYLEWLMTPPGDREPRAKTAMAEELGVSFKTLYNWESEPLFQEKLRTLKLEWGNRWYPDILAKLYDTVLNGPPAQSVAAAKVLLAHINIMDETKDTTEYSSEALEKISAALKDAGYDVIDV
jgi:hypothetical protein